MRIILRLTVAYHSVFELVNEVSEIENIFFFVSSDIAPQVKYIPVNIMWYPRLNPMADTEYYVGKSEVMLCMTSTHKYIHNFSYTFNFLFFLIRSYTFN